MFVTPQTADGLLVAARAGPEAGTFLVDVRVPVEAEFAARVRGRERELTFAARSRLARLGINIVPRGDLAWDGDALGLTAKVEATVSAYGIEPFLERLLQEGLRVGRLVFCAKEQRLTSEEIYRAVEQSELQLPADYSIDGTGRFRIRPRGVVYDLIAPLTLEDLYTITMRADGKDVLNRMQVRRDVKAIELPPGDGVITSCSMFLHKHFVVLDPEEGPLGQHLEAVVLDPISTRGMDVFLEFTNRSDQRIVNPTVGAEVYRADALLSRSRRWYGTGVAFPIERGGRSEAEVEYEALSAIFDRLEHGATRARYSHRTVALTDDPLDLLAGRAPLGLWNAPEPARDLPPRLDVSSRLREGVELADGRERGTTMLADLERGARATLLLTYFPNLVEHLEICAAALERRLGRVVFRHASYEHGSFLSARDHGRLADLEGLGLDVFWCNDARHHVVRHVFRGLRGFFTEPQNVERFRTSLIVAVYGSAKSLPPDQLDRMRDLLGRLHAFFGGNLSIMTGGGPGAMQQATDFAHELGMLVGASFIETVDQRTNQTANFYQTFQGRSRQARQRWFEIASFHLFMMGGVGTLEEVGLTLTDMKLGVIERSPLVFFGCHGSTSYWAGLREQFEVMVEEGRAPPWLLTHSLVTDDPEEIVPFYKRVLELG